MSTAPLIDGPDDSPDLLSRPPARGPGVRRLNRVPLFIGIGLALVVALLLVYTASTRGQRSTGGGSTDPTSQAVTASTPPDFKDAPTAGAIPPAVVGPTIDPTTGAVQGPPGSIGPVPPSTQQVVVRQRPPNPYEQEWARYHQQREQVASAREAAFTAALNAPSGVQLAREGAGAAPGQPGQAGGAGAVDPTLAALGAGGGLPGATPAVASAPASGGAGGQQDNDSDYNGQGAKRDFLKPRGPENNYSPAIRQGVISPYELKAGTVIPAVMLGGINSDLPGQILGQVSENVYDTKTGKYLLIPQGAKLVGTHDNSVTNGQTRVLVVWSRVIFPDASSLDLDMMPGADQGGFAGFHDKVNNHFGKIFGSALLLSAFSAGVQLSQPRSDSILTNPTFGQTATGAVGQQLGQTGEQVIQRNLRIQPTLQIRPGYRFNVTVTKDLIIRPWRQ